MFSGQRIWTIECMICGLLLVLGNICMSEQEAHKEVVIENILSDGDFEDEELKWEVVHPENGFWEVDPIVFKVGTRSLKMCPKKSSYTTEHFVLQQQHNLQPGKYVLEAWMRIDKEYNAILPWVSVNVYVPKETGSAEFVCNAQESRMSNETKPEEWVKVTKEIVIRESSREMVYIQLFSCGSFGTCWFDDVFLSKVEPEKQWVGNCVGSSTSNVKKQSQKVDLCKLNYYGDV